MTGLGTVLATAGLAFGGAAGGGIRPDIIVPPISDTTAGVASNIRPFGLLGARGARQFRRSIEVDTGMAAVELRAMGRGKLSLYGPRFDVGPARAWDQTRFLTTDLALVLQVSLEPDGFREINRLLGSVPSNPLRLPGPTWVIYEGPGVEINPQIAGAEQREVFDRLENAWPAAGQTFAQILPSALLGEFQPRLREIARTLVRLPDTRVKIFGHCDSKGGEDLNERLSERRAEVFKTELLRLTEDVWTTEPSLGPQVAPSRIETTPKGKRELRYVGDQTDAALRELNRRVEIRLLGVERDLNVEADDIIGTATGTVRITVLDQEGHFLDPMDVVRRYDIDGLHTLHPLMLNRDPLAPSIASGRVFCVSPAGTTPDAAPTDDHYVKIYPATQGAPNLLADVLADRPDPPPPPPTGSPPGLPPVGDGDVIWLCEIGTLPTQVEIDRAITLVSKDGAILEPLAGAPAEGPPLVVMDDPRRRDLGLRLLGLKLQSGRTGQPGGAAVRLDHADDIQILRCTFVSNVARNGGCGGAVRLTSCNRALIEDCVFWSNEAVHGGAIYAEDCTDVVLLGRPRDDASRLEFQQRRDDATDVTPTILTFGPGEPYGFTTHFVGNFADGAGGGIALIRSTFWVQGCHFQGNQMGAQGFGGAVAAVLSQGGLVAVRASLQGVNLPVPGVVWNAIQDCLFTGHFADGASSGPTTPTGGAIAIIGTPSGDAERIGHPSSASDLAADAAWLVGLSLVVPLGPVGAAGVGAAAVVAPPADDDLGAICLIANNVIHDNGRTTGPGTRLTYMGGGLHLAGGAFRVEGNRISANQAYQFGGGASFVGLCDVRLAGNRLLGNDTLSSIAGTHLDFGPVGGGALYGRCFDEVQRVRLVLVGNTILGNRAGGDGGAILLTAGARAILQELPNVLKHNDAGRTGGAISVLNATLIVRGSHQFEGNNAEQLDGGAIAAIGGSMFGNPPPAAERSAISARALAVWIGAADGTTLEITATQDRSPTFVDNTAGRWGGAIIIWQQRPVPIGPSGSGLDRTIGIVRGANVSGAQFGRNTSDAPLPSITPGVTIPGVTVAVYDLDQGWLAQVGTVANDHLPIPPGAFELRDLLIEVDRGYGVFLLRSDQSHVPLPGLDVRQRVGETGEWRPFGEFPAFIGGP